MIVDTVEYIGKPHFGVDALVFAGGEEGVDHGGALGRLVRSGEEVVFASDGDGSDNIFHEVIIDFNIAVGQEQEHVFPAVQGVLDGFSDGATGGNTVVFTLEPLSELVEDGFGFFEPQFEALFGIKAQQAGFFFHLVEQLNEGQGGLGALGVVALSVEEFPADVGHTIHQGQGADFFVQGFVHAESVALQHACKTFE